ncbi:MAG: YhjD/YihY/BrkB family envelope integrity protein [Limisphaerales bacterium]
MRASSLAYATLLALVPMLAVVISVSASLLHRQGEDTIERFIDEIVQKVTPSTDAPIFGPLPPSARSVALPDAEAGTGVAGEPRGADEVVGPLLDPEEYARTRKDVASQIRAYIGNIRSGALGMTGSAILLVVAISMLSRIEDTFNDIWGITRGRSWFARIVQYWAAITLGPIVLAVTLTLTSGPYFTATRDFVAGFGTVGAWTVKISMELLPYVIWSLAFALFYQLMPNTKVNWRAAAVGGLVGGCLFQLNSEFSVLYINRFITNTQIYGPLGIIPVFMAGVYLAWLILLFGGQVAYSWQNRASYLQEKRIAGVHQRSREFIGLRLAVQVAAQFLRGDPPATLAELATRTGVPTRLVSVLLQSMVEGKLLVEVRERETAYAPARPLDQISAHDVLTVLRTGRGIELATRQDPARALVRNAFDRIGDAERGIAGSVTLQALADQLAEIDQESAGIVQETGAGSSHPQS